MRVATLLDDFAADVQYAARWLRRSPAFTFIAVLTLAIGLGANTAIFTIVDQLLLEPLPYTSPDRLVRIFEELPALGFHDFAVAPGTLLSWRERATSFEEIAFFVGATRNVAGEGNPDMLNGIAVSTNLLRVLGVQPVLGRAFQEGDGRTGTEPVVMIADDFWRTHFAAAKDIVGRTIRLDGQPHVIIGVLPPSFRFPASTSTEIIALGFLRLMAVQPGFNPQQLFTFKVRLTPAAYRDTSKRIATYDQLLERLESIPGVEQVAAVTNPPFSGGDQFYGVSPEGAQEPLVSASYYSVSTAYFSLMGITLLNGRAFSAADRRDSLPVVIISDSVARSLFGESDPIGRRIRGLGSPREVIGIVTETKHNSLDSPTRGQLYLPYTQDTQGATTFVIRAETSIESLITPIRARISEVDAELPLADIRPMDEAVSASMSRTRFTMTLSVVFAVLALLLAAIGTYGVLTFYVAERTSEVGLRMALGATAKDVLRLVLIKGLGPVTVGLAFTIAISAIAFRFMDRFVFEAQAADAWLLVLVSAIILLVACVSIYIPARRACRIDPMSALRTE